MMKKILMALALPLLLTGCASTMTNLTPLQQTRNGNNLYPVEVAFESRQQTLRWDSIKAQILVGTETYKMRQTPLMRNRWEGVVPVAPGSKVVRYRYRLDYDYNAFGAPRSDSTVSKEYVLRILD